MNFSLKISNLLRHLTTAILDLKDALCPGDRRQAGMPAGHAASTACVWPGLQRELHPVPWGMQGMASALMSAAKAYLVIFFLCSKATFFSGGQWRSLYFIHIIQTFSVSA